MANELQFLEKKIQTFRQFGESVLMVLIANIRHRSTSDAHAVVFHNSYATGTEKFRITKMTTRSPIHLGTNMEILSFALHDRSHAINTALR